MVNTRSERNLNEVKDLQNRSFDSEFDINLVEPVGFDGQNLQRMTTKNMAVKVTVSGTNIYVGLAAPGTTELTAKWQVKKIDSSSGIVITWADGDCKFDNSATDLTLLNYL